MAPIARQISQAEKHLGGRFCFTTSRRADLHGRQGDSRMLPGTRTLLRYVRLCRSDRQQVPRAAIDGLTCADARIEPISHKIVNMARHGR
jgi:hypothetical protein